MYALASNDGARVSDAAFALVGAVVGYLLKIAEGWFGEVEVEGVVLMGGSEAGTDAQMLAVVAVLDRANARLGVVLRDLY